MKGDKKDPMGIYSARFKPKVKEILHWINRREELERLID